MNQLKEKLNQFMSEVRRDNPNANWGNLLTGILILVLIAVFSVWYFGKTPEQQENLIKDIIQRGTVEEEMVMEETADIAVVAEGEGLWNVAERVCGDGEAYNVLAEANGLTIWSAVAVGQELTVVCE